MNTFKEVAETNTLITYRSEKMKFVDFFLRTQRDTTLMDKIIKELQPEDSVESLQTLVDEYESRSR